MNNDVKNVHAIRREVGMVFQHFNLFPHLTMLDNLTLAPIWVRGMPKKEAEEAAMFYLNRVASPSRRRSTRASSPAGSSSASRSPAPCA